MRSLLLAVFLLGGFLTDGSAQVKIKKVKQEKVPDKPPYTGAELDKYCSNPKKLLVIKMKTQGTMKIQLFDKVAPGHVAQITKLAQEGKYNGCTFHRIIRGFMIQGGDPNSKDDNLANDGSGGMGEKLKAEFSSIPHVKGIC